MDVIAYAYNGAIYCPDCLPAEADPDFMDECAPIFEGAEFDYYPVCDKCGYTFEDEITLTEEGRYLRTREVLQEVIKLAQEIPWIIDGAGTWLITGENSRELPTALSYPLPTWIYLFGRFKGVQFRAAFHCEDLGRRIADISVLPFFPAVENELWNILEALIETWEDRWEERKEELMNRRAAEK